MKMSTRLLSVVLAIAMMLTGMLSILATAESTAFTGTELGGTIWHLGIENPSPVDGNYQHYRYAAQEFVPAESNLSGVKIGLNLTVGDAVVHMEIREDVNGEAIASNDYTISSKGDGANWYEVSLGQNVKLTVGDTYYVVYWLKSRSIAGSSCIAIGSTSSQAYDHPGYAWQIANGGAVNFVKNSTLQFSFELVTTEYVAPAAEYFTSWTAGDFSPFHLALSTATAVDGNYNNYRYVAQEFVPESADLYGAKLGLHLTAGEATVHMEVRSDVNGAALASTDVKITSVGNTPAFYDIPLASKLTVTPGKTYYLAYWLTARDAGSLCLVRGSDVGANGAKHPAYVFKMADGGNVNFTVANSSSLIFNFELLTQPVGGAATGYFTKWTDNLTSITHLGLSTANPVDGNWRNYRYIAQEFVPESADLYGAKIGVNLTAGDATVHMEIRSSVNGAALAQADVPVKSLGNALHWYTLPLNEKLTVTPGNVYYLVYYLTARDATSVCVVHGSDVGPNNAAHPGYVWKMADGGNVNFTSGDNNNIFAFEIVSTELPKPDESKPDESKPDESKPDESKPDESEPEESEPEESKPQESEPQESKPDDENSDATGDIVPSEPSVDPQPPVEDVDYGDIDGNGKIEAKDALWALQYSVSKRTLDDDAFKAGDVNGDNKVDAKDALLILQYSVQKITQFPVEKDDGNVEPSDGGSTPSTDDPSKDEPSQDEPSKDEPSEPSEDDMAGVVVDPEPPVIEEGYGTIAQLQGVSGYAKPVAPIQIDEVFNTLTQNNSAYSQLFDLDLDCVLAYVYQMCEDDKGGLAASWVENKHTYDDDTTIGIMVAVNRDNAEYLLEYAGNRGMADVQTKADGSWRQHSVASGYNVYYMVPTAAYLEYKWQVIDSYLKSGNVKVVALEEPEMWNNAGYSQGYKEEFKKYYGEDWMDPNANTEAVWKHQKFKAWLFKNAFEVLSGRIKEKYPDVTVLITSHSTMSYAKHGISTGTAMYASIPTIDGVIGQTWSDDASQAFPYAGNNISNIFMNAMYAYNSYGEFLTDGQSLYLLQDPSSDNGEIDKETLQERWKQTVVAAMMQNDTTSFQSTIWPQRAFQAMGMDYKTIQLNVNKMYQDFHTLSGAVYGATPGVALASSDTMGWHLGSNNVLTGSSMASFSGIYYSLQNDGVQVDTVCLDNLTDVKQLEGLNVIILPYDAVKPLSATANDILAQWTKNGGRLLFMAGHDAFADVKSEWWGKANTTPYKDLFAKLGLTGMTVNVGGISGNQAPSWSGSSLASASVGSNYAGKTLSFTGSGFNTFMTLGGKNVGVTATVGKGQATLVGLPSAFYSTSMNAELGVRELVAKALNGSGIQYKSGTSFVAVRGNYFAYYSPSDSSETAEDRVFIDLFNSDLTVIPGGSAIPREEAVLYYDVTNQANSDIPRIAFTGGTETARRYETAEVSRYTITYPSSSVAATVLLANGKFPQSVTAKTASGKSVTLITAWDPYENALTVKASNPDVTDPITFEVIWGDEYVELPTNYVYDSFTHFTTDKNLDNDVLLDSKTGHVNDGCYFCDLDTEFIWKIDLETYMQASMTLDIYGNYTVDVAFDNKEWISVADWSTLGGPVGNTSSGYVPGASNRTSVTVNASDYAAGATAKYMYVRLGSCYMNTPEHPGGDHGGSTYSYMLTYLTPAY